jgi:hypothetical protein
VRRLLARAAETYRVTPRRSLGLSQVAVTCAVIGTVAPALVFTALKDFGSYSLRAADDLDAALGALDVAEAFVPLTDDPVMTAAILAHARAYIYGDSTCAKWDRAIELLDECEPIFEQRDPHRFRGVRHFRAAVLLRRGDYCRAAELFETLLASESDAVSGADLRKDLAECYCRMGRPAEALALVNDALVVLNARRHTQITANASWTRGTALSGVGEHDEAVRTLEAVSRFFAAEGLNDDELGAELSLIRAMLAPIRRRLLSPDSNKRTCSRARSTPPSHCAPARAVRRCGLPCWPHTNSENSRILCSSTPPNTFAPSDGATRRRSCPCSKALQVHFPERVVSLSSNQRRET